MSKIVTYLYPKPEKAMNLKVFQNRTNQVRAFYFTRDAVSEIKKLDAAGNHAVYFLFDETEEGERTKVVVGQSAKGIHGIQNKPLQKVFWSFCLMFVTDNDSFDTVIGDYLEHYFGAKFEQSSQYITADKAQKKGTLKADIYDKPVIYSYIEQIEFLLQAERIKLQEEKVDSSTRFYYPADKEYDAKIFVKNGKFILAKESLITKPISSLENWSDGGIFYSTYNQYINDFLEDRKIVEEKEGYRTLINLSFTSPSTVASLISGVTENGWSFFEDLNELRE